MPRACSLDLTDRRILIAEDEHIIALDMKRAFERCGAIVVGPASTIEAALELATNESHLDGAVLDVNLRNLHIFPVADVLRRRRVPYVFATGYDIGVIPEAHRHAAHCEKPVLPEEVAEALYRGVQCADDNS